MDIILKLKNELNTKKYQYYVSLDDYYSLIKNEVNKSSSEIIWNYWDLYKIGESFYVFKSDPGGHLFHF